MKDEKEVLKTIDADRLAGNIWRLVSIPSPTGREKQAALAFAGMLAEAGAEVELDESISESPNVIGRLRGSGSGKTVQLAGHIDHIHDPHPAPQRKDNIISGRGSADMKGGLAGILEIVRVLKETGCDFPGQLLVTVFGLHEMPWGSRQGLKNLINSGIKGDAAIVAESFDNLAVVAGKGQCVWDIVLRRRGEVCHELVCPPKAADLLGAMQSVLAVLRNTAQKLSRGVDHPLLGSGSLFIGQIHYGDFYNRAPNECRLQGTRRWLPGASFAQMKAEFDDLLNRMPPFEGIARECSCALSGEAYQVDTREPVIQSQIRSYKTVTGKDLEVGGTSVVTDACRLVNLGDVPTAVWGFDTETAHSDHEFVRIDRVCEACRIVLLTVLDYLNVVSR